MSTAIKVENLSKIYRLGEIGTGTITQDIDRWFKTKVLGKEDPFLKIGESNDRTQKGSGDIVYSLQDINFEINQGDAVGIIGRNGAGKSTLLKILSRVTTPTTGKIKIKGRVASLLEVGTGFHPELTGRENIYLNGAILGMRKREIDRKLDEIIDFAGVERYIDTPVKRYSSGMYVRLAFAVAAHLESEILIVDEVLAVGDAEFQKKCLGKLNEVNFGEGRTVLFVSHNIEAISNLCKISLVLKNGQVTFNGDVNNGIEYYLNYMSSKSDRILDENNSALNKPKIINYSIDSHNLSHGQLRFRIEYSSPFLLDELNLGIVIKTLTGMALFSSNCKLSKCYGKKNNVFKGTGEVCFTNIPIYSGTYYADLFLGDNVQDYDVIPRAITFDFMSLRSAFNNYDKSLIGHTITESEWTLTEF
jgi:lipopolysaccharide transport system ATP-binding protein